MKCWGAGALALLGNPLMPCVGAPGEPGTAVGWAGKTVLEAPWRGGSGSCSEQSQTGNLEINDSVCREQA